jgi:drug/metabolite transporter (DMT)-like permease
MKTKDFIMLFSLAAVWGASFLFMRIAAPALGPTVLIELRVLIAGLALVVFAFFARLRIHILHKWRQYLLLGALNAAIPFTFISTAELHLSAGLAAILNATTPLFTAIVAWLWAGDPMTARKLSGVTLGIIGVAVLVGWNPGEPGTHVFRSALFSLLAAVAYAFGGLISSKYFKGEKPLDMAIGQQLGASLVLLPFSVFSLPHEAPSALVILSALGLAVLCTSLGYLLYFGLIQSVGAVKTLTVTFIVPVFGIVWGALFLGEPISVSLIIGLLIILTSIALVADVRLAKKERGSLSEDLS